jgi:hypothetical protein
VRNRMILDLPPEVQKAVKLRAVKNGCTTGEVIADAVKRVFPADVTEAEEVLKERERKPFPLDVTSPGPDQRPGCKPSATARAAGG